MSETIDTTPPGAAIEIGGVLSSESSSGSPVSGGASEGKKPSPVRLLKGPGVAKAYPAPRQELAKPDPDHHHARTLNRWTNKAREIFVNSPHCNVICAMVEKRIPFVGGDRFALGMVPLSLHETFDRLKKFKVISPEQAAMMVFQSIRHDKVSTDHIRSICQLVEEGRISSIANLLSVISANPADSGVGVIRSNASMAVDDLYEDINKKATRRDGDHED